MPNAGKDLSVCLSVATTRPTYKVGRRTTDHKYNKFLARLQGELPAKLQTPKPSPLSSRRLHYM